MYCAKCGNQMPDNAKFCTKCGNRIEQVNSKFTTLTCPDCGGHMTLSKDSPIIACPYCGSTRLMNENDSVRIERIKQEADFKKEKIKSDDKQASEERDAKELKFELIMILSAMFLLLIISFLFGE